MQQAKNDRTRATQDELAAKRLADANATTNHFLGAHRRAWMTDAASVSSVPTHPTQRAAPRRNSTTHDNGTPSHVNSAAVETGGGNAIIGPPAQPSSRPRSTQHFSPSIVAETQCEHPPGREPVRKRARDVSQADLGTRQAAIVQQTQPSRHSPHVLTSGATATANLAAKTQPPGRSEIEKISRVTMDNLTTFQTTHASLGTLDKQRLSLLKSACAHLDLFFLILHQLFCVAFTRPFSLSAIGFGVDQVAQLNLMVVLLVSNEHLSAAALAAFIQLPCPLSSGMKSPAYQDMVHKVDGFLNRFAMSWKPTLEESLQRGYPPFTDEICDMFDLDSPILQISLFISIHRKLGGIDTEPWSRMALALFYSDQAEVRNRKTGCAGAQSTQKLGVSARHQRLRRQYIALRETGIDPATQTAPAESMVGVTWSPVLTPSTGQTRTASESSQGRRASVLTPLDSNSQQRPLTQGPPTQSITTDNHPRSSLFSLSDEPPTISPTSSSAPARHRVSEGAVANGACYSLPHQTPSLPNRIYGCASADGRSGSDRCVPARSQELLNRVAYEALGHPSGNVSGQPPVHHPNGRPRFRSRRIRGHNLLGSMYRPIARDDRNHLRGQVNSRPVVQPTSVNFEAVIPPPGLSLIQTMNPDPNAVALHQAYLKSPVPIKIDAAGQRSSQLRLYQYVSGFALRPTTINPSSVLVGAEFVLSADAFAQRASDLKRTDGQKERLISQGCFQYRLRSVEVDDKALAVEEADWPSKETSWPPFGFFRVNDTDIELRRKTHHGKDLPADLTNIVCEGVNRVAVAFLNGSEEKTAQLYAVAVEVVEVGDQDQVDAAPTMLDAQDSLRSITEDLIGCSKTGPPKDSGEHNRDEVGDDDIKILDSHISIDLIDPFMATIFVTPARGRSCTHRECFDLPTFFQTRKSRSPGGPTGPDEWRCPICRKDARPCSLVVDCFLKSVRESLVDAGTVDDAKAILVASDGSWKIKHEYKGPVRLRDRSRSGSAVAGTPVAVGQLVQPSPTSPLPLPSSPATAATSTRPASNTRQSISEVIEIDDDD